MTQTTIKQQDHGRVISNNSADSFLAEVPQSEHPELHNRIRARSKEGSLRLTFLAVANRTFLAGAACAAIGVGGMILAQQNADDRVKITRVSQQDIIEKLDGKATTVTTEEVAFEPGQTDTSHRHSGAVLGYVLEGEYEHALNDEPPKTFKAGETFYEPSGTLHRVARNPSSKTRTRLLAVFLHPRGAIEMTTPVKGGDAGVAGFRASAEVRPKEKK